MVSSPTAAVAPRRRLRWAALVAATMAVLTACVGQSPTAPTQEARTLVVGASLEPPTLDPSASPAASIPQLLLYNVYQTLVRMNEQGELEPLLAQTWNVSSDRTVYTFKLNPAARFASGTPVTAEAVVTSFDRIKTENISAPLVEQMTVVKSTEAVDEHTVKVTLSHPSNLWLYDISSTAGIVYDPAGLANLGTAPAGSGPFVLQRWNKGQSVVLAANPDYWGTPSRLDLVTFRYFADPNAMNTAMLAGDLDVISNLQAPDALDQFGDTSRFTVMDGTTTGEVVLALNNARSAFKDVRVRRAISMAIDKKALLDTVWNGQGSLIGSMAVPTDPWYEDLTAINGYDRAEAKKLLAAAKATDLSLKLRVPTTAYATKSAQFVESALREVGVKVTVEELDFATWLNDVHNGGNYDMSIVAHVEARDIRRFTDPDYYFHFDNADFDKEFEAADEAPVDDFVPLMKKATRTLATDAAAVWLFALPNLVITKNTITGVPQNAATLSFDLSAIAKR
ncbi:ABC transporter substrate-binding protein [Micropruina sonneratiae]|uniref:ABC transporter substrate-binding protein n=1 Tax=Micropruina sonneratiae TaxID=2986940 RepID=UPI002227AF4A|nr:ABC transporter substrate-binding protein [Micropruina sp. KQZ13P-5]MCW3157501.1 ABC transporter substrate-binding protein [Micropruina sp. KQZ13P-5]